jgi:hypothetical protein
MAQQSRWRRWFGGGKEAGSSSGEVNLIALQKAYLKQRRQWDYAIAFCALLTVAAAILRPFVALLPAVATVFAVYQYRKCNQIAHTIWEAEELRRLVTKLQAEAQQAEEERQWGEE